MFDLRYHVASLAAVFLMLVVGILIGVGISGRGFVDDSERDRFRDQIAGLQEEADAANATADDLERRQEAAQDFVTTAYPVLVENRLAGKNIAVAVLGSLEQDSFAFVESAIKDDADGRLARTRAVMLPLRLEAIEAELADRPEFGGYVGEEQLQNLGRDLGRELVTGGETPLWDALAPEIVEQQSGGLAEPVDGVVVVRSAEPQAGASSRFLAGFYQGLAGTGVPVVGVEPSRVEQSAIPVFQDYGLSTVDGIDTELGQLAMVLLLGDADPGNYGIRDTATSGILPQIEPLPHQVGELTILIAARDEEARIGTTIAELRQQFPEAQVVVADDGSRDATARVAEDAGARVVRLPHRGKGQALTLGEREAPPGDLVLCDADLRGDLGPLLSGDGDVTIAAFTHKQGGGLGIAKEAARRLIRVASGYAAQEPLSGQRRLTQKAREAVFPLAAGFGCEAAMTADAMNAGLEVAETELPLEHRATTRDLGGFLHRGRQLRDIVLAFGPQGRNHRGLRLPLVGWLVAVAQPSLLPVAAIGVADDLWSGEERGFRAHLRARRTTGILKLVGIPAYGLWRTRSVSGAILVGLSANLLNQLDTKPGRALKVYLAAAIPLNAPKAMAVLLAPYDLREMAMLGDSGSNTLGAVLGLRSVGRLTERQRWSAIAALAGLTLLGERRSLGGLIERTPVFRQLDGLGRQRA